MNIQPRSSSVEILEDRIAPAGVVTINETAPGEFTLTGDNVGNVVNIFQTAPGAFRMEGVATTLNAPVVGAVGHFDITKLTKLTILAADGTDTFTLTNLGLTSLLFDGGADSDTLNAVNVAVKGNASIAGGGGFDFANFDGLTTLVTGNLTLDDSAGGGMITSVLAVDTTIGGKVAVVGGDNFEQFNAAGSGNLTIGKGVDFNSGSAVGGTLGISQTGLIKIGKLVTGESVLFAGTDGGSIGISTGDINLAGGIRFTGGVTGDGLSLSSGDRTIKVGKLPTGESILFNGGAGSESLTVTGMDVKLAGGIDFNPGNGGSTLTVSNANGKITVGKLSTGQSIKYTGGVDSDSLATDFSSMVLSGGVEFLAGDGSNVMNLASVNGTAKIGKMANGASLKFTGGTGSDTATLSIAALTLAGGIDFAGGDGANSLTENAPNGIAKIGKLTGGASIKYAGGGGTDAITTANMLLNLAGGIDYSGGAGVSTVSFGGPNGKLQVGKLSTGQSVKYTGGTDADSFSTNVSSALFAGGFEISADDGSNQFNFTGGSGIVSIGKLASGQSVRYTGGGGTDDFLSGQAVVILSNGIEFNPGNGSNEINFDTGGNTKIGTIATGQSIKYTGGNDTDEVFIGGFLVSLKGSMEMTGDSGSNNVDFDGLSVNIGKDATGASILLTGGAGADRIDIEESATLAGSITLDGAAGSDTLDLTGIDRLKVGGPVTVTGGADDDLISINAFSLSLAKGLTFNGGDGADDFSVIADGTITGDVIANLGGATANDQAATLTSRTSLVPGLFVKGALSITSTGTAASTDTLLVTNVSVSKALITNLGAGVSTVTIDNLFASDVFTLNTGDGADVVNFEVNNFFGNSIITKIANIVTGAGADTITIGFATPLPNSGLLDPTRVRFLTGLNLDGGANADVVNSVLTENDFPGGAATLVITNIP